MAAAASIPACRQPPPNRLRRMRASAMLSAVLTNTESLGERDGDSVEEAAIAGEVNPGRHMSVPQPSAVQVAANTVVMAQLRHTGQLVQRLYRSATEIVRVLHRDGGSGDQERICHRRDECRHLFAA